MHFLLQAIPQGGAVEVPQEITVSTPEILAKFTLVALAALGAAAAPWLMARSRGERLRCFGHGALYALMPAVVIGAALASLATGVSLTRIKYGGLSEFWPLPLAVLCFAFMIEALGGALALASRAREKAA